MVKFIFKFCIISGNFSFNSWCLEYISSFERIIISALQISKNLISCTGGDKGISEKGRLGLIAAVKEKIISSVNFINQCKILYKVRGIHAGRLLFWCQEKDLCRYNRWTDRGIQAHGRLVCWLIGPYFLGKNKRYTCICFWWSGFNCRRKCYQV